MATVFEELRVLRAAEEIADQVWGFVVEWDNFARDVVGKQLARAADSVGANIAEAYGRFHYGDKLQFLYYARGSLFETKYWLNRAAARKLIDEQTVKQYADLLSGLAHQLNVFANTIKRQRSGTHQASSIVRENTEEYVVLGSSTTSPPQLDTPLFTDDELSFISLI
jgi:four helix bundle protein